MSSLLLEFQMAMLRKCSLSRVTPWSAWSSRLLAVLFRDSKSERKLKLKSKWRKKKVISRFAYRERNLSFRVKSATAADAGRHFKNEVTSCLLNAIAGRSNRLTTPDLRPSTGLACRGATAETPSTALPLLRTRRRPFDTMLVRRSHGTRLSPRVYSNA